MEDKTDNALELRLDYQATMNTREEIESLLDRALLLVKEAQRLASRVGADFEVLTYYKQGSYSLFSKQNPIPSLMRYFDSCAWDRFFEASGVGQFMSEDARQKWKQAIHEQKVEALTPENIRATFKGLMDQSSEFLIDGIVAVARLIAWDRVTNTPTMFTPKVILRYFCMGNDRCVRQDSLGHLDDLDRCLRTIEGKDSPPSSLDTWRSRVPSYRYEDRYHGVYFDIRICGSVGTCHIWFNERGLSLLPELNRLLATRYPSTLGAPRTKRTKTAR